MYDLFKRKRREPRVKLNTSITVSGKDANGQAFSCDTATADVSPHGASFTLDVPIRCGAIVEFRTRNYNFNVRAVVRTVEVDVVAGCSVVGVEYLDEATNPVVIWGVRTPETIER